VHECDIVERLASIWQVRRCPSEDGRYTIRVLMDAFSPKVPPPERGGDEA